MSHPASWLTVILGIGGGLYNLVWARQAARNTIDRWIEKPWFGITQLPDRAQRSHYERQYRVLHRIVGAVFLYAGIRALMTLIVDSRTG